MVLRRSARDRCGICVVGGIRGLVGLGARGVRPFDVQWVRGISGGCRIIIASHCSLHWWVGRQSINRPTGRLVDKWVSKSAVPSFRQSRIRLLAQRTSESANQNVSDSRFFFNSVVQSWGHVTPSHRSACIRLFYSSTLVGHLSLSRNKVTIVWGPTERSL